MQPTGLAFEKAENYGLCLHGFKPTCEPSIHRWGEYGLVQFTLLGASALPSVYSTDCAMLVS